MTKKDEWIDSRISILWALWQFHRGCKKNVLDLLYYIVFNYFNQVLGDSKYNCFGSTFYPPYHILGYIIDNILVTIIEL